MLAFWLTQGATAYQTTNIILDISCIFIQSILV